MEEKATDGYFERPRLRQKLEGIAKEGLTVITAPVGFGKTAALRRQLGKERPPHLWFQLYEEGDPGWAWAKFCGLVGGLDAALGSELQGLGFPGGPAEVKRLARFLAAKMDRDVVVVLDDCDGPGNGWVGPLLKRLALERIPPLHLVLSGRYNPIENPRELSAKGFCRIISWKDFQFSPKDVEDYFRANGAALPPPLLEEACARSEGWIFALREMLDSYRACGRLQTEDSQALLLDAMLHKLEPEQRRDLFALSIAGVFTAKRAVWQTGGREIRKLLEWCCREGWFVRHARDSQSYALHPILRELLLNRLEESGLPADEAYRRNARWNERNGELMEAIQTYDEIGEYEQVVRILESCTVTSSIDSNPELMIRIFSEMPFPLKIGHPLAYLTYLLFHLTAVDFEGGARMLREFRRYIAGRAPLAGDRLLLGEIALAELFTQFNDLDRMTEWIQRAERQFAGDVSRVQNRETVFSMGSPSILHLYHNKPGELAERAQRFLKELRRYVALANGCGAGADRQMYAELLFETGRLEEAERERLRALPRAEEMQQTGTLLCSAFLQGRLAVARGDGSGLRAAMARLERERGSDNPYLACEASNAIAYLEFLLGRSGKGTPEEFWPRQAVMRGMFPQGTPTQQVVCGNLLLAARDFSGLASFAYRMRWARGNGRFVFQELYADIFLSIARLWSQGCEAAAESWEEALRLAEPDGILLPFVEYGGYLAPLLRAETSGQNAFVARIAAAALKRDRQIRHLVEHPKTLLTPREFETWLLLGAGGSRKEIAGRLGVSLSTLRVYVHHISQKLGDCGATGDARGSV